eukprot:TRINITY_DN8766_c0_g1_i5.p2 TRINITY_DN8766_c0_g1~~TRINITY_DN8766_c0_g1_i5.p2  ORF type:complete len:296 (+),score=86.69 TRINITY_DN8766_c0_g1_i5:87-890(+)
MCIRDRVSTQSTWGILTSMLKAEEASLQRIAAQRKILEEKQKFRREQFEKSAALYIGALSKENHVFLENNKKLAERDALIAAELRAIQERRKTLLTALEPSAERLDRNRRQINGVLERVMPDILREFEEHEKKKAEENRLLREEIAKDTGTRNLHLADELRQRADALSRDNPLAAIEKRFGPGGPVLKSDVLDSMPEPHKEEHRPRNKEAEDYLNKIRLKQLEEQTPGRSPLRDNRPAERQAPRAALNKFLLPASSSLASSNIKDFL